METYDFIKNFFESPLSDISSDIAIARIITSLILGLLMSQIYRITHSGISYSSSFSFTICISLLLSCSIIIVVGENVARAFALVGALAIIRFRTVIKDPKDLSFIFASLVIGMAAGAGLFFISIFIMFLFSLVSILVKNNKIFKITDFENIVRFSSSSTLPIEKITQILSKHVEIYQLLSFEKLPNNNGSIATFEISKINEKKFNDLNNNISKIDKKLSLTFVAGNSSISY